MKSLKNGWCEKFPWLDFPVIERHSKIFDFLKPSFQ
jgi:hypothetical protein